MMLGRPVTAVRRPPDNRDVRDDLAPDTELRIFQSIADPVDIELGSGPGMGRWYWWRSPSEDQRLPIG